MVTEPEPERQLFDPCGGHPCLDFVNTVSRRPPDGTGEDHVHDYGDLLLWSLQAGTIDSATRATLTAEAARRPADAERVLARAKALREASWRLFSVQARGGAPAAEDLEPLNAELGQALAHSRVTPRDDGFGWCWAPAAACLDAPLWPLARSAAELLVSDERTRVKECGAERCLWLFLDTTRNQCRRWCDMSTCGNRAKVRKHRRLQRERRHGSADP